MPGLRELEKFNAFSKRIQATSDELVGVGQELKITIDEFRETIENPPQKKPFPFLLVILVSTIEVLDSSEILLGITGIYSFIYGCLRLFVTAYLWYWSFNAIDGIKLINVRRNLLKNQGRRMLLAVCSNLPIPYIGIVLRLFPMDLVFVILSYNDQSKAVQLIWAALGNPKSLEVITNITRTKTGPSGDLRASAKE
jgi:hypothetical protein